MRTRRTIRWLISFVFIFWISDLAIAGNKATQALIVNAQVINKASVRGTTGVVGANTFAPGPGSKVNKDNPLSYTITVGGTNNAAITGKIDSPMPDGTAFYIRPATLKGATSQGNVRLSTTEQDLLTGIPKTIKDGAPVTYSFTYSSATTTDAGEVRQQTKPVTVTLTVAF